MNNGDTREHYYPITIWSVVGRRQPNLLSLQKKKLSWLQAVSESFFNVTEGKLQTEHMIYFNDKLTSIILLQSNAHGTLFRLKRALKSL